MKPIDWGATVIRWLAMMFSLGAWAGVVLVVLAYLG
jgi:hypothetical protein